MGVEEKEVEEQENRQGPRGGPLMKLRCGIAADPAWGLARFQHVKSMPGTRSRGILTARYKPIHGCDWLLLASGMDQLVPL